MEGFKRDIRWGEMCRLCGSFRETVHLLAGCKVLADKEYLHCHNKALMVIAIEWAKKYQLVNEKAVWYNEKWEKAKIVENSKGKLTWDFEHKMGKVVQPEDQTWLLKIRRIKRYYCVIWHARRRETLKLSLRKRWININSYLL